MKRKELDAVQEEARAFVAQLPERMRSGDVAAEKARIAREIGEGGVAMKKWGVWYAHYKYPGWCGYPEYRESREQAEEFLRQLKHRWPSAQYEIREYVEPLKRMTLKEAKRWVKQNAERALYEATFSGKWEWVVQIYDGHEDVESYSGRTLVAAVEAAMKAREGR